MSTPQVADATARVYGCTADVSWSDRPYLPTVNDAATFQLVCGLGFALGFRVKLWVTVRAGSQYMFIAAAPHRMPSYCQREPRGWEACHLRVHPVGASAAPPCTQLADMAGRLGRFQLATEPSMAAEDFGFYAGGRNPPLRHCFPVMWRRPYEMSPSPHTTQMCSRAAA